MKKAASKYILMTGNSVLLDTNIISGWLKGESSIADNIDLVDAVYIPIIVIGELEYGAQYSSNIEKNINSIKKVIEHYEVLYLDKNTAEYYGIIKANLRKKGKPIPENDIWIAAIAKQHNLLLISRDKHFQEIESIQLAKW